jgi:hypothetical protein
MKLDICSKKGQFVTKGLTMITDFLSRDQDKSVVVFCNSCKQSQHFSGQLEKKLEMAKLNVDVLDINGPLVKINKFWWIRLFCDHCHSCQGQFCALVTTNASNVGIDKHSMSLQVPLEWPWDLIMCFQEHGRGSCWEGAKIPCILYGDLDSYVYLMGQLLTRCNHDDNEEVSTNNEVNGFNSAISPQKTNMRLGSKIPPRAKVKAQSENTQS